MLNDIPEELLHIIIKSMDNRKSIHNRKPYPSEFPIAYMLSLKATSKRFRDIIQNYNDFWEIETGENKDKIMDLFTSPKCYNSIFISQSTNKQMNELCKRGISKKIFTWLLKNNISLSLENIHILIRLNRTDLIKAGFHFKSFLKILFNRFYVNISAHNELFSITTQTLNPILVAGNYERIEIIDLLLKAGTVGNPYLKEIETLFSLSIKKGFKKLFSYLVIHFYDTIQEKLQTKISSIMCRMTNAEDIFFYLIVSRKVDVTDRFLSSCIYKDYYDLFVFSINHIENSMICYQDILSHCFDNNNYRILNYLFHEKKYTPSTEVFTKYFIRKKNIKYDFLAHLIKNYSYLLEKECSLIHICLINNLVDQDIINLLNEGFYVFKDDIQLCLMNDRFILLEHMIKVYNSEDKVIN